MKRNGCGRLFAYLQVLTVADAFLAVHYSHRNLTQTTPYIKLVCLALSRPELKLWVSGLCKFHHLVEATKRYCHICRESKNRALFIGRRAEMIHLEVCRADGMFGKDLHKLENIMVV